MMTKVRAIFTRGTVIITQEAADKCVAYASFPLSSHIFLNVGVNDNATALSLFVDQQLVLEIVSPQEGRLSRFAQLFIDNLSDMLLGLSDKQYYEVNLEVVEYD